MLAFFIPNKSRGVSDSVIMSRNTFIYIYMLKEMDMGMIQWSWNNKEQYGMVNPTSGPTKASKSLHDHDQS